MRAPVSDRHGNREDRGNAICSTFCALLPEMGATEACNQRSCKVRETANISRVNVSLIGCPLMRQSACPAAAQDRPPRTLDGRAVGDAGKRETTTSTWITPISSDVRGGNGGAGRTPRPLRPRPPLSAERARAKQIILSSRRTA